MARFTYNRIQQQCAKGHKHSIDIKLHLDVLCINCYTLGKNPTDQYLDEMMNCAPGPINFTMFLTMFGEKLNGTDPEDVIKNAFACFDEDASGEMLKHVC